MNVPQVAHKNGRDARRAPAPSAVSGEGATVLVRTGVSTSRPEDGPPRKVRRLVAGEQYFGLDALAFHAGAGRVVARLSRARDPVIDAASIDADFVVDPAAGRALVKALVAGGLLQPDGNGRFRPTAVLHEHAEAHVVMPLTRDRAKALVEKANQLAARINATWQHNRYLIDALAVSGSYMTGDKLLRELSLWLVVRRRDGSPESLPVVPNADDALREIGAAMKAISSFVVVRVARDAQEVRRPFTVVFEAAHEAIEQRTPAWRSLRDLHAMIRERLR